MSEITLKEYIENRLEEADKRYEQRFTAQEEALKLARSTSMQAAIVAALGVITALIAVFGHLGK